MADSDSRPAAAEAPAPNAAPTVKSEETAEANTPIVEEPKMKEEPAEEEPNVPEQPVAEESNIKVEGAAEGAKATEEPVTDEAAEKSKPEPMIKTTARIDPKHFKKNVKFDPTAAPASSEPADIRRQVEFYFSDSNLPVDKFMWNTTGGTENKPVPLKTLTTFGRMRRFQPYSKVVEAIKESKFLVLEGEEGKETVKRKTPYNSDKRDNINLKSVYVKGFGDEQPSTQFDLEAFFTSFGSINSVRLRRTPEKLFKGSVFVEFVDEETHKKFLELDPKPTWNGHELLIMSKTAYVEDKCTQIREGKIQAKPKKGFFEGQEKKGRGAWRGGKKEGRGDHKNGGDRGGRDNHRGGGRGRGSHRGGRNGHRGGRNGASRAPAVDVAAVDVAATSLDDGAKTSPAKTTPTKLSPKPNKKRSLDAENAEGGPASKKVDTKNASVAVEAV